MIKLIWEEYALCSIMRANAQVGEGDDEES